MGPPALPTLTVVIPTNGGRTEIMERTLPVLLADSATSEVIVAFDADDPATRRLVDSYARKDDRVRGIDAGRRPGADNRGQSAREAGVGVARGDVVLALDDDVEPQPGLVSGHARRHAEAAADSVVLGYMPVALSSGPRLSGPARLYAEAYENACAAWRADEDSILRRLWGGHFSLPRERWLEVARDGPLVDAGYHVDLEFGLRVRQSGLQGVFDPSLRATHRFQRTPAELLRDAQSSGRAQARLHAAYPDLVSPAEENTDQTPALVRGIVRLSRSRLGWRVTIGILLALSRTLGAIGLSAADYAATKLLWRVGFAHGVRGAG